MAQKPTDGNAQFDGDLSSISKFTMLSDLQDILYKVPGLRGLSFQLTRGMNRADP